MKKNPNQIAPRITIAALRGGSGKTIATLGITKALANRGGKIAVFKKGPDYIDAAWLGKAAGRACHNLDPFLMDDETISSSFLLHSGDAELAIIEGNRGLFDGVDVSGGFSTAQLAKTLGSPIVLVADCTKVTRTMAAMIKGCKDFEQDVEIIGIILNKIAGRRHRDLLTNSIETYADLPVLGTIPRLKKDPLPMRHLGVIPADEYAGPDNALEELGRLAEKYIDIDRLIDLASKATRYDATSTQGIQPVSRISPRKDVVIGIIRDSSFQFYYPENIEALRREGARLVFLNALTDDDVPEMDALYIGGGFPETQAERLAANRIFMDKLRDLIESGLPVYAECGGLMYLGRNLSWQGNSFPMVGILPWDFVVKKKPVGHGYSVLECAQDSVFYKRGDIIKGHEFHYSLPQPVEHGPHGDFSCMVVRGHGFDGKYDGYRYKNVFGTYTHVHALGDPDWGKKMVEAGVKFKKGLQCL